LPRLPYEGPIAYAARAGERWPQFAAAFATIGDAYAMLRYGFESSLDDDERRRASLLSQLERAIHSVPKPAALRRLQHAG
jgi:hypothetical protein